MAATRRPDERADEPSPGIRTMKRVMAVLARSVAYVLATVMVLVLLLGAGVWLLLPTLEDYKPEVERLLSDYLGQEITITELGAEWDGLNVTVRASGVRVAVGDHPGSGMRFGEMYLSFDPLSVFDPGKTFERLELLGPTIEAARLADGRYRVGDTIIGTPRGTLRRLLQGRNLVITDGTLVWRDALAPDDQLRIEDVHARIHSQDGRRDFELTALVPKHLVEHFQASGSYDPQALGAGAWTGSVDVSVTQLNLARIPAAIQEQLPWRSRGRLDTGIHAEWTRGLLTRASADVTAYDFVIPYARDKPPLAASRLSSSLFWRRSDEAWRLVFTGPEIVLDGKQVSVSRFEVERRDAQRTYTARDANLQDLLGVANELDIELPWKKLIDRLEPRGRFARAALTLTGPYLEARDWRFEGHFEDVGWRAQERYPGVQGLDGRLRVDRTRGELSLDTDKLQLDAPASLARPVGFERAAGTIEWYRWGSDWVVDVGDGELVNDDLHVTDIDFYTRVQGEGAASSYVSTRLRVPRADVAALHDYLPVKKMTDKQVAWLHRALAGGELSRGRLYLNGPLDAFPYDDGQGELKISARVRDGVFDFHEEWPDLEALEGVIELDNAHLEARIRRGRMMGSPISHARMWSEDFFQRDRTLFIQGDLAAQANDVVQFLRRGPLNKNPPPAHSTMTARGAGTLSLMIELPFTRLKEAARVQGVYTFDDVAVEVADGIELTDLQGAVRFTEHSVAGEDLTGKLLGGAVKADVSTVKPGKPIEFAISGTGTTDVSRLTPVIGPVMTSRLAGEARWNARFVSSPGPNRLYVSSDLAGVEIQLPEPLWKSADAAGGIDVQVELERDSRRITLDLADRLTGELHYQRQDGKPVLERGVLNLGGDRELPAAELVVSMRGDELDVDQWLDEIQHLQRLNARVDAPDSNRDALFEHLRVLDIDVANFRYLHRDLGPVAVQATSNDSKNWQARLSGRRLAGKARLRLEPKPGRYELDMTRLYWPRLEDGARATTYKKPRKPSEFVHLSISADDFRYDDMRLGALRFRAGPEDSAWVIEQLSLHQPVLSVEAQGRWVANRLSSQRTGVSVSVESDDLGTALTQLGLNNQVAKGTAKVDAELSWPGEPGGFGLGRLDGRLTFNAEDGRFLKVEPGSGRLLGLFNMDTLVRRFKLDFTDVFKEGLAFDRIEGEAGITAGRLQTDGIFIIGPAALLELNGSTHLGDETYDLVVTVAPQLGGNLSLAGAIANPAAGAMLFVAQKLFKKQMAKLIHFKYRVTGDWHDPQVASVRRKTPDRGIRGGHKP